MTYIWRMAGEECIWRMAGEECIAGGIRRNTDIDEE